MQRTTATAKTGSLVRDKWGRALDYAGFQTIPNLLFTQQQNLGLSTTDLVVLLHINRYWWTRDQDPFPRPTRIAEQMGLHRRSVERCLKRLEEKGLIARPGRHTISSGRTVWPISLSPLAAYLGQIAKRLPEKVQSDDSAPKPTGTSSKEALF